METQQQKPRRIWRIVLVVSLALNLLVIGVVGGAVLRFGGMHNDRDRPPRGGLIYFREMPHSAQKDIRDAARAGFKKRDTERAAQMGEVLSVLRAAPFDPDGLRATMTARSSRAQEDQMRMVDIWIGHVEQMSDAERVEYADRVEAAARRHMHGDKPLRD